MANEPVVDPDHDDPLDEPEPDKEGDDSIHGDRYG